MTVTRKGFTLIELLVVIAIIALLMSILLPSLNAAKELASGAVCLANQKNLCLGWKSYAEDNDNYLIGGSNYYTGARATPYRWVEYPMNISGVIVPEAQYSQETRKYGIQFGKLFKYCSDINTYHCPGDKNFKKKTEPYATFRSYAIAGLMNGEDFISRSGNEFTPINSLRSATVSPSGLTKALKVAVKMSDIVSPGEKYVYVEEDAAAKNQTVNAGGFVLLSGGFNWWDAPAYFHNDSATLGFADGHAERHRWEDKDTIKLAKLGPGTAPDPDPLNNPDLAYMARGYLPCK